VQGGCRAKFLQGEFTPICQVFPCCHINYTDLIQSSKTVKSDHSLMIFAFQDHVIWNLKTSNTFILAGLAGVILSSSSHFETGRESEIVGKKKKTPLGKR
jgi:hypothetical protein